jgi:hypothetical protein
VNTVHTIGAPATGRALRRVRRRHQQGEGEDEVAAAVAVRAEDTVKADSARCAEGGGDVAVGPAAGDGEGVPLGGDDAAPEHAAQAFDMSGGPVGKVAERAFADFALVAVALAGGELRFGTASISMR